ncbi:MAG: PD40 domain-containing protein, partial [Calditrichaeota bacterium]|nr:PD40 domain-containing protein [Calditrichota bacterium]
MNFIIRTVFSRTKTTFLFFLIVSATLISYLQLNAQERYNHPELRWQTIESDHFIVHYHQGTERTANMVSKIAEEIYPHITGLYQFVPKDKTQFIVRDTDDYSNGGAYFYENKIEIWSENMDYILRGTHNWLRDVVTHEYSHIISLQKAFKFGSNVPMGWLQAFGYEEERRPDVVRGFPNVLVSYPISGITIPVWFAEGLAQFQAPSKRFDYRDSHREMILRDRVMTSQLLDLNEMSVFGKNSIGNESSYNQGFAFVNFLTEVFGDSIVKDLAVQSSSMLTLDFNGVLEKTTGIPADSIFRLWKANLEETYSQRLNQIKNNLKEGAPLSEKGIGNIFPTFSPDGENLAYLESVSDYLSVNALVVKNIKTSEKRTLTGPIASSISWSPNGRYLTFAKQTDLQPNGSSFYDIYVYDMKRFKTYRLTKGLRATNPDWSHDGQQLAFVVNSDGLTNLYTLTLDEFIWIDDGELWKTWYYDLNDHTLVEQIPEETQDNWELYYRKVEVWGRGIHQLTHLTDGRQIFHPRWAPDDSTLIFDTSINFCRDIAQIPARGGEIEFLLNEIHDERYPVFSPSGSEIFYASDETGIFNIYSYNLETGEKYPHTNVTGGAFMPSINERGDLAYSLYKNQGYKLYWIQKVNHVPPSHLTYFENYSARIPVIQADDSKYQAKPARGYKNSFGPIGIMPRLLLDYGTVKPGFYIYSNEILDKMTFLGGFDVNLDLEYNIFALTEFTLTKPAFLINLIRPSFFFEFYNQTAKIEDKYEDPDGFTVSSDKIDIGFNLMEADAGLRGKFRDIFSWELSYIYSLYKANIGTYSFLQLADQQTYIVPEIRYSYLRGHALSLLLKHEKMMPELDRAVNPRNGYYMSFRYTR